MPQRENAKRALLHVRLTRARKLAFVHGDGQSDDNPASWLYNTANLYSRARLGTCPAW